MLRMSKTGAWAFHVVAAHNKTPDASGVDLETLATLLNTLI